MLLRLHRREAGTSFKDLKDLIAIIKDFQELTFRFHLREDRLELQTLASCLLHHSIKEWMSFSSQERIKLRLKIFQMDYLY